MARRVRIRSPREYLEKVLSINAVPEASRLMLTGAIIMTAVLLQRRRA